MGHKDGNIQSKSAVWRKGWDEKMAEFRVDVFIFFFLFFLQIFFFPLRKAKHRGKEKRKREKKKERKREEFMMLKGTKRKFGIVNVSECVDWCRCVSLHV
jgi:hypothetical protein